MTRPSVVFPNLRHIFQELCRKLPGTSGNFLHNLRQHCLLFYCYRLRQISWLIDIFPFANGYMVGQ